MSATTSPDEDVPARRLRKHCWIEHHGVVQQIVQTVRDELGEVFVRTSSSGTFWMRLRRDQRVGIWHDKPEETPRR